MSLVFWDTNLWIYAMEDHPEFAPKVQKIRERMIERQDRLCTSALTIGELLAGPYRKGNHELAARYKSVLYSAAVEIIAFTAACADHYARLRADGGIAPPDAIQLACAAQARVDLFLTSDRRLSRRIVPGIQFIADVDAGIL